MIRCILFVVIVCVNTWEIMGKTRSMKQVYSKGQSLVLKHYQVLVETPSC